MISTVRRRLAVAGGCGTAALALVVGSAVAAFGNAANPTSASATVWDCGQHGAPSVPCSKGDAVVEVAGHWSWGELADQKSSPQKDCAGRYGVGWSVDWWGMSDSPTASAVANLAGSTVTPATKTAAPAGSWGSLTPDGAWQVQGAHLYFHTSALYNGFLADLCNNATQTSTGPEGSFQTFAVYPSRDAIPPQLCVNFYDPHGKQGQWSTSDNDNYASKDGDNSIKTNDFNPQTVSGYCLVPHDATAPRVVVGKSGPATGSAGGIGTYTITLTNKGDANANGPTDFVDELPAGESFDSVDASGSDSGMSCKPDAQTSSQLDCRYAGDIAAGASKSVAVVIRYGADTGGQQLTDCAGLMPSGATACVTTQIPPAQQQQQPQQSRALSPAALDLAIAKTASASSVQRGDTLVYTLQVTNVSRQPTNGSVTVTDALPGGVAIVGTPAASGWTCSVDTTTVTCTLDQLPLGPGDAAPPIDVTTSVTTSGPTALLNTGVVSTPGDVNPANNRSTVRTPVTKVLGEKVTQAPPATPPNAVPPATPTPSSGPSQLPFTGWNASTAATLGVMLLLAGLRVVQLARRRRGA